MRIHGSWSRRVVASVAVFALAGSLAGGQQIEEGKRKTKSRINPVYPDLARKMNIYGKVRVEAVIAQDGHVKSVRAVGGSPVLIQPCLDAVRDWRFETAPEETTQLIEFNFSQP